MRKREAEFQSKFTRWLRHNGWTGAYELKAAVGDSPLPFTALADHQRLSLMAVKHGALTWKLPDDSRSAKPFDSFVLKGEAASVVVHWVRSGNHAFYIIDIDEWVRESESSVRRSLTETRAKQIGQAFFLGTRTRNGSGTPDTKRLCEPP